MAKAWFISLMQGDSAVTTSLSAVPFAFDRKQEVNALPELKALYDKIVAEKGVREARLTAVKIASSSPERVEVVIMLANEEKIAISVKPGEAFQVVGFSD